MPDPIKAVAGKLGTLWCDLMHDSAMWPIHGQYQCRTCGRSYPVWAEGRTASAQARAQHIHPVRSALLPAVFLLLTLAASIGRAGDLPGTESNTSAGMAFARYVACAEQAAAWNVETVDIDASLPKLAKTGRLHAIRRLLPLGKPEYQVLELAGDQTVKQQVIVRYLSAEVRAAAIPAASVAITPVNYKFRYKGSVPNGETLAYVFQITPREKREGLIKGEVWIDADGVAVRQSGYLVKRPSIFVKRLNVTRETIVSDGIATARVTRLSVDTRLVGRAELTIEERPYMISASAVALNFPER